MKASEQCQGRGCDRKSACDRYFNTNDWPFPIISKLCDGRFVAFRPKMQVEQSDEIKGSRA